VNEASDRPNRLVILLDDLSEDPAQFCRYIMPVLDEIRARG